jgi:hypothetical protein
MTEKTNTTMQDVKASLIAKMDGGEVVRYDQRNIEQTKIPVRARLNLGRDAQSAPDIDT